MIARATRKLARILSSEDHPAFYLDGLAVKGAAWRNNVRLIFLDLYAVQARDPGATEVFHAVGCVLVEMGMMGMMLHTDPVSVLEWLSIDPRDATVATVVADSMAKPTWERVKAEYARLFDCVLEDGLRPTVMHCAFILRERERRLVREMAASEPGRM